MEVNMKKLSDIFVSAVIVAAGKGTRMNMDVNKQYIDVCGKPVLARTLHVFEECKAIKEIVLVVNEKDILYCMQNIIDEYSFSKVKVIVAGGEERQNSVYNGLIEIDSECDVVLIHDGARPFVNEESINKVIQAAKEVGAACIAVPVKDTIKQADDDDFVDKTLDRSKLWSIQTPQAFIYGLIIEAHKKAIEDGFTGTDDTVLVERIGHKVKLVMGGYDNIKITTKEDIAIAEALIDV